MVERALIVAIEHYPSAAEGFTAKTLDGTLAAGQRFRQWLEEKWRAEGTTGTVLFCSEPRVDGQLGATLNDIIDAVVQLKRDGRNQTDNFYFYFSGHGFRLAGDRSKLADVLVASDFRDVARAATTCFKLDALVEGLRVSLGHGCHYYFIDACRNEVSKAIGSDLTAFDDFADEEASVFVLQSTVAGAPALVAGPFATLLVEGLRGAGKAKAWAPPITDSMQVRFDSLRGFLKTRLQAVQPITQSTSGELGEHDAVLATIKPVPSCDLTLTVRALDPAAAGVARIAVFGSQTTSDHPLTGGTLRLSLPPNSYMVSVSVVGASVRPAAAVPVDLYEHAELTFDVGPPAERTRSLSPPPPPPPPPSSAPADNLDVIVPRDSEVVLRNVDTGAVASFSASQQTTLPAGTYATVLRQRNGPVLRRGEVVVRDEGVHQVAPATWRGHAAQEAIAAHFPQKGGGVWFTLSLGPVVDPDPAIWLAILGGGRILEPLRPLGMMERLPLVDFSGAVAGASPIYVLAAMADETTTLRVGLSQLLDGSIVGPPRWLDAREPPGLAGVREAVFDIPAGPALVTLALGGQTPYTLASVTSPNRCTLITVTTDEDDQLRVAQYLLPIGRLVGQLHPAVQQNLVSRNPLRDVYTLAQLMRAFRKRRRLDREFTGHELEELLYNKWVDPIGASLAAYECVRRNRRQYLDEVAHNLMEFFPDLPDSTAIARLAGKPAPPPDGVPLFLDGLRALAFDAVEAAASRVALPFPSESLDYTGPWTAWRAVVEPPIEER